MIFQIWQLNSANKQVSWRNESKLRSEVSKPISKFLFQQFSFSKSKLEDKVVKNAFLTRHGTNNINSNRKLESLNRKIANKIF